MTEKERRSRYGIAFVWIALAASVGCAHVADRFGFAVLAVAFSPVLIFVAALTLAIFAAALLFDDGSN